MPLTPSQVEQAILVAQPLLRQLAKKFRGIDRDDLISAANVKLIETLPSQESPDNIEGYIRVVAHNAMLDHVRRERGRGDVRPEMKSLDDPGRSYNYPVRQAAEEHNAVEVEEKYNASLIASAVLMQLTDVQRKVVWAVAAEEKTFAEVGEELGLSRSRAHQIYTEALDLLRGGKIP
jgi:RNA polymerase sigma factor (sigma-70 family)